MARSGSNGKLRPATLVQRKFLLERLYAHCDKLSPAWRESVDPEPEEVLAARKVLDAWEKSQGKRRNKLDKKIGEIRRWLKEQILFADRSEALALLNAFEGMNRERAMSGKVALEDVPRDRRGGPDWDR